MLTLKMSKNLGLPVKRDGQMLADWDSNSHFHVWHMSSHCLQASHVIIIWDWDFPILSFS